MLIRRPLASTLFPYTTLFRSDVRDKVNSILSDLPVGTDPPVIDKFDLDAVPVMSISVSAPRDLKEITFITDKQIKQNLETVRSEEHTSELQSPMYLVCRLLLE